MEDLSKREMDIILSGINRLAGKNFYRKMTKIFLTIANGRLSNSEFSNLQKCFLNLKINFKNYETENKYGIYEIKGDLNALRTIESQTDGCCWEEMDRIRSYLTTLGGEISTLTPIKISVFKKMEFQTFSVGIFKSAKKFLEKN